MVLWFRRPSAEEVVDKVLEACVTEEQLKLLDEMYDKRTTKEEILRSARLMTAKYSVEKSIAIAKSRIEYWNLDKPTPNSRINLRHLFTRQLLKG